MRKTFKKQPKGMTFTTFLMGMLGLAAVLYGLAAVWTLMNGN